MERIDKIKHGEELKKLFNKLGGIDNLNKEIKNREDRLLELVKI